MEAQRQPEAVGECQGIVPFVPFVERGGGVLPFEDGTAIGGHHDADVRRAGGNAAFQQAPECKHLRPSVDPEAEIVDEDEEGAHLTAQRRDESGEGGKGAGSDLHQRERLRVLTLHIGDGGAHQSRFSHAARAPQQRVVGREAFGEATRVVEQDVAGAIDAVHELAPLFDIYALSTAPWANPTAWHDKLEWIKTHFGAEKGSVLYKRLILSHHKHLNRGDFLVDDRPEHNGVDKFPEHGGEVIHFGEHGTHTTWPEVVAYLKERA